MAKATFQARVQYNRAANDKVFETGLELVEPTEFHFKAGQFVTIPVGEKVLRSYSIASTPKDPNSIYLIVDISPGGPGSVFFRDLREGDSVSFQGPYGAFWLRPDTERELIFVGTGTGIAPLRGMLLDLDERGEHDRPITLFYGQRYREELMFHDEFLEMKTRFRNLKYYPTISQPRPGTWDGMVGRVTAHIPHYVSGVEGKSAFLCGSKAMLKDVREILMGKGMERKKIKQEQFF